MRTHSAVSTILTAGVICGTLDGISAIVIALASGGLPIRVFQSIASGALGRGAFQGGVEAAVLGVVFHFMVAIGAATVYYFASRPLPVLLEHAVVCGVVFGALVHFFMTFVVIPLSAIGRRPFVMRSFVIYLLVAMVVVGPSISVPIRRLSPWRVNG